MRVTEHRKIVVRLLPHVVVVCMRGVTYLHAAMFSDVSVSQHKADSRVHEIGYTTFVEP